MLTKILPKNARIAVAVSGGADSVVLLDRLAAVAEGLGLALSVAHCEHGIRGQDSLRDAAFTKALAKAYGLPFTLFSEDCIALAKKRGVSLETAAREFRYRCFEEILASGDADYIALAHHLDDEAETVLFRISRGTSIGGAQGMQPICGRYLRPLLDESKEEILAYAAAKGLEYCQDETNLERVATRNILRLDVLPALEKAVHGAKENLAAFAAQAKEDDELLCSLAEDLVQRVAPENGSDTGYRIKAGETPLVRRACLLVMRLLGIERDYTSKHLQAVAELFSLQTGAQVTLLKGVVAVRAYGQILFKKSGVSGEELPCESFRFGEFAWGRYLLTVSLNPIEDALRVDADKIGEGAVVRQRREGDVFRKFGGREKSLKKYLIDKKIPQGMRDGLPVLAVGSKVLAVFGVEIAEDVKVTDQTKKTAYLAVKEK